MKKRFLSMLLVVLMLLTLVPISVFAEETAPGWDEVKNVSCYRVAITYKCMVADKDDNRYVTNHTTSVRLSDFAYYGEDNENSEYTVATPYRTNYGWLDVWCYEITLKPGVLKNHYVEFNGHTLLSELLSETYNTICVYIRADNKTYAGNDNKGGALMVLSCDHDAPTVTGLTAGQTYCGSASFQVADSYLDSVYYTCNGTITTLTPNEGIYTITACTSDLGNITVTAKDTTGNKTEVNITVNKHTDANPKDHICDRCTGILSQHSGGTATCKSLAVCDYCGESYGEKDKTIHDGGTEIRNAIEETCTNAGYTGDTCCKGCGAKLSAGDEIAPLGHVDKDKNHVCDRENCKATISEHTGGTATCKKQAVCDYCGENYGELDETRHEGLIYVPAKKATASANGNKAYWYCTDCGKCFTTKECTTEMKLADTVIAKLEKTEDKSPDTGDHSDVAVWVGLLLVSCCGLTVIYANRKKYRAK